KGIRETLKYRSRFQIPDNVEHFLDRIKEIGDPGYIPTFNDYVLSLCFLYVFVCTFFKTFFGLLKSCEKYLKIQIRIRTTGYAQEVFFTRTHDTEVQFQFIDVGGQRSERRKWMQFVKEEVDCVVYVVGMSDYDLVNSTDFNIPKKKKKKKIIYNETKRLDEALSMFADLAKNQFFDHKTLIVFFNKFGMEYMTETHQNSNYILHIVYIIFFFMYLFEEKLNKVPFKVAFPEISDEEAKDSKLICKFLKQKFLDIIESTKVKLVSSPHFFSTRALSLVKVCVSLHVIEEGEGEHRDVNKIQVL
ncbi:G-protein alpha subunit, partial [Reticulomyxa filosa]